MTPYATLMVKPLDGDLTIRQAYHALAKRHHPDKSLGKPVPKEWYAASAAYAVIKTEDARRRYADYTSKLAGVCQACSGSGVKGTRVGRSKVRICVMCEGEGRIR
jgi:DnaJ-class molecular chaperone